MKKLHIVAKYIISGLKMKEIQGLNNYFLFPLFLFFEPERNGQPDFF